MASSNSTKPRVDITALKAFALAKPKLGSYLLGANIAGLYGTNTALILGIFHEMQDILERGDSQLKHIPLTKNDMMSAYLAFIYLSRLAQDKASAELGPETLPVFLETAQKLCNVYYTPKITATEQCLEKAQLEWQRLEARFDFLVQAATKDLAAANLLHDEFYADGLWDPELADHYEALPQAQPGTTNLTRERKLRKLKATFANCLKNDMTRNPIFSVRAMLGTPENMAQQSHLQSVSIQSRDRNTKALETVASLINELQAVITPPVAQIYAFPGKPLAKPQISVLS